MAKVQKISQISPTLGFTEFDIVNKYRESFKLSELGRLHSLFPFDEIADQLKLIRKVRGRKSIFSPKGKIALMVLKSYTNLSDQDLIAHLNGNIHYQLFCDLFVDPLEPITRFQIVSDIRGELASKLDISSAQQVLAQQWKPYLKNLHVCMTDATCYESDMRHPTDVKLLWESVHWLATYLCKHCRMLGLRQLRNKYTDVRDAYLSYSKKRRHTQSGRKKITRRLISLLGKLISQTLELDRTYAKELSLSSDYHRRFNVIQKVLVQAKALFDGKKVSNRIVSVDKHYIRPIVRGKESKSVEFGAKVNNIQVDGISFIEHISFNAFNEGTRLKDCIHLQQQLFKVRVRCVAADAIYATNANRSFCTRYSISTSFVRKGRASKNEKEKKILRLALARERATRMEGSFGTQKRYYSLNKIKARNKENEILWIFFGIHTANAVVMIEKVRKKELDQNRAA